MKPRYYCEHEDNECYKPCIPLYIPAVPYSTQLSPQQGLASCSCPSTGEGRCKNDDTLDFCNCDNDSLTSNGSCCYYSRCITPISSDNFDEDTMIRDASDNPRFQHSVKSCLKSRCIPQMYNSLEDNHKAYQVNLEIKPKNRPKDIYDAFTAKLLITTPTGQKTHLTLANDRNAESYYSDRYSPSDSEDEEDEEDHRNTMHRIPVDSLEVQKASMNRRKDILKRVPTGYPSGLAYPIDEDDDDDDAYFQQSGHMSRSRSRHEPFKEPSMLHGHQFRPQREEEKRRREARSVSEYQNVTQKVLTKDSGHYPSNHLNKVQVIDDKDNLPWNQQHHGHDRRSMTPNDYPAHDQSHLGSLNRDASNYQADESHRSRSISPMEVPSSYRDFSKSIQSTRPYQPSVRESAYYPPTDSRMTQRYMSTTSAATDASRQQSSVVPHYYPSMQSTAGVSHRSASVGDPYRYESVGSDPHRYISTNDGIVQHHPLTQDASPQGRAISTQDASPQGRAISTQDARSQGNVISMHDARSQFTSKLDHQQSTHFPADLADPYVSEHALDPRSASEFKVGTNDIMLEHALEPSSSHIPVRELSSDVAESPKPTKDSNETEDSGSSGKSLNNASVMSSSFDEDDDADFRMNAPAVSESLVPVTSRFDGFSKKSLDPTGSLNENRVVQSGYMMPGQRNPSTKSTSFVGGSETQSIQDVPLLLAHQPIPDEILDEMETEIVQPKRYPSSKSRNKSGLSVHQQSRPSSQLFIAQEQRTSPFQPKEEIAVSTKTNVKKSVADSRTDGKRHVTLGRTVYQYVPTYRVPALSRMQACSYALPKETMRKLIGYRHSISHSSSMPTPLSFREKRQ